MFIVYKEKTALREIDRDIFIAEEGYSILTETSLQKVFC